MTAQLMCDGCGRVVSERNDDENATTTWWLLSAQPMPGGVGLLKPITLTMTEADEDEPDVPLPPPEPDLHFCATDCLASWASTRAAP